MSDKAKITYIKAIFVGKREEKGFCNLCLNRNPERFFKIQTEHYAREKIVDKYLDAIGISNDKVFVDDNFVSRQDVKNANFDMTLFVCDECHGKHYQIYDFHREFESKSNRSSY